VGISASTASAWLSVLEATGQVALLEPWFTNRGKSLVKSPKLYLADTGLAAFLAGLRSASELSDSPLAGALWETLVFGELRRLQVNRRGGWDLHFWRDRSKEADFLFHRGGNYELADAKWTAYPRERDAAVLTRVAAELGLREGQTRRVDLPLPASLSGHRRRSGLTPGGAPAGVGVRAEANGPHPALLRHQVPEGPHHG